ncbi:ATP-grasp domain-containing protein [Actinoplanes sp. NPDC024001]|uniref:ATP-grasp domain-containing protein n=1 Tax=Actinoplanes sp. NPDC024001 TaxID=3154598 RepID=UPI0033DD5D85
MLLFPADVMRPRRVDEHFAEEARAAREAGHPVALIDHDAASRGDAEAAVARVPAGDGAVYRGWMLGAGHYAALVRALAGRGVSMRTSAEQYRRAHELPGWYAAIADQTPESVWTSGDGRDDFDRAAAVLGSGPVVLRDYTKSMKHYWHEAAYVPDVADTAAAWTVASRLRELRGDEFTGGFVLRRFEELGPAEVRTWWVAGQCRLITAHPDTPHDPPGEIGLAVLGAAITALDLPFVTADLAPHADGRWRVVEIGDGQVSDRPRGVAAEALITAL